MPPFLLAAMTGGMNNGPRLDALLRQVAQGAPPHKKAKVRTFDDISEKLCMFFELTWSMINTTLKRGRSKAVLTSLFMQEKKQHLIKFGNET